MKRSFFGAALLIALASAAAYADANTEAVQTILLDDFSEEWKYQFDGEEYVYGWRAVGSRYVTKTDAVTYPQAAPIKSAPRDLERRPPKTRFGQPTAEGEDIAYSLGVKYAFDRKGNNWVDIFPTLKKRGDEEVGDGALQGRTKTLDIWAWGSNNNYTLDAYIRDNTGRIHVVKMGSLKFTGWKNLRVTIPASIPLVATTLPRSTHDTTFVKFRVWSDPKAKVATDREKDGTIVPIYLYLSQLKVFADLYETTYDGDELADPKITDKLWDPAGKDGGGTQGQ